LDDQAQAPQLTASEAESEQIMSHGAITAYDPSELSLARLTASGLAELAQEGDAPPALRQLGERVAAFGPAWRVLLREYLAGSPCAEDAPLFELRERLSLTALEVSTVGLAIAVERDTRVSRLVASLQAPSEAIGPTLGLLELLFAGEPYDRAGSVEGLLCGPALACGLLELHGETAPLVERSLRVPSHVLLALGGVTAPREGYALDPGEQHVPLPPSTLASVLRYAHGLSAEPGRALLIRAGAPEEARAIAREVAAVLGARPVFISTAQLQGLAPWLYVNRCIPVFETSLGPSERFRVPPIAGYTGPQLVIAGRDGGVELAQGSALTWNVEIPGAQERRLLWARSLSDDALAEQLAPLHRHGISRIAELGNLARQRAAMDGRTPTARDVLEVAHMNLRGGLGDLAEPVTTPVTTDMLVLPEHTQRELELLVARCTSREELNTGLGPSAQARYRPGVRALFTGASGTGKTLACSWLATRLGTPLYRVDIAAIVSKYIGETERNLSQLLARAEHADVMLLFDEADSLFAKRTEVRQSNDRFANTQTNYLLQRLEAYDGIVVLTTNHKSRLDAAFTRRLDIVVDFPEPRAEERRELWRSHLGAAHTLSQEQLNQLSMLVELAGGHIRNIVLCAAVLARLAQRPIGWDEVYEALNVEYRKLGKQLPSSLRPTPARSSRPNP